MSKRRKLASTYVIHSQSGRGRLVWYDAAGVRQQKLLPGPYGSKESMAAKAKLEFEIATSPTRTTIESTDITVVEVMAAYLAFAEKYYVAADGKPTKEYANMVAAVKPMRETYAETLAAEFGPRALAAVRQHMIRLGWCRSLINHNVDRIRRAMKWAASEELIPVATYQSLRTLAGLRRGRTEARESDPVKPVPDEIVKTTLPYLPHHICVMVELLMHTGMRPSEVCAMTLNQIDRDGDVWNYRPLKHKTAHHGKERVIPLGPNARAVLSAFLDGRVLEPNEPIFSPRRAREERFVRLREDRKSKVQPSQVSRKTTNPKRQPAMTYTPHAISHAISVAAMKASVEHWHTYQLRHAFATKARKLFGLEHVGAALGHTKMSVTEVYAARDAEMAATVAAKIG